MDDSGRSVQVCAQWTFFPPWCAAPLLILLSTPLASMTSAVVVSGLSPQPLVCRLVPPIGLLRVVVSSQQQLDELCCVGVTTKTQDLQRSFTLPQSLDRLSNVPTKLLPDRNVMRPDEIPLIFVAVLVEARLHRHGSRWVSKLSDARQVHDVAVEEALCTALS